MRFLKWLLYKDEERVYWRQGFKEQCHEILPPLTKNLPGKNSVSKIFVKIGCPHTVGTNNVDTMATQTRCLHSQQLCRPEGLGWRYKGLKWGDEGLRWRDEGLGWRDEGLRLRVKGLRWRDKRLRWR